MSLLACVCLSTATLRRADGFPGIHLTAGSALQIWTDGNNLQTNPPLTPNQAWERTFMSTAAIIAATIAVLSIIIGVIHLRLNRIRYAAWAEEWRRIDPRRTRNTN